MAYPTFIVADDDPFMREWLELSLHSFGARVVHAASGHELAALLAPPVAAVDLVISDVRMPGPSGLEVLARARAGGNQVPFLLITGFGGPEVVSAARAHGASVLQKPFSRRELLERVSVLYDVGAAGGLPGACSR